MSGSLPERVDALAWDARDGPPSTPSVHARLRREGVDAYAWTNGPGDRYAEHEHPYTKLLMCAEGSITFFVGHGAHRIELRPGDGFVLPAGTRHSAVVGRRGCTCVEGHRPSEV